MNKEYRAVMLKKETHDLLKVLCVGTKRTLSGMVDFLVTEAIQDEAEEVLKDSPKI